MIKVNISSLIGVESGNVQCYRIGKIVFVSGDFIIGNSQINTTFPIANGFPIPAYKVSGIFGTQAVSGQFTILEGQASLNVRQNVWGKAYICFSYIAS